MFDPHFSKDINNVEWWNNIWQYSANTTLLFFVPQHALAGWIATSLIIDKIKKGFDPMIFFIWSLTILWSPFVALGLIPFLIIYTVFSPPGWLRKYISYHPGGGKTSPAMIILSVIILLLLPIYKYGGGMTL